MNRDMSFCKPSECDTGGKLYTCGICVKSFTQKYNLTQHMIIHSGDKSHMCGTCGKSFTQVGSLTKHILIHFGDTPHYAKLVEKHLH